MAEIGRAICALIFLIFDSMPRCRADSVGTWKAFYEARTGLENRCKPALSVASSSLPVVAQERERSSHSARSQRWRWWRLRGVLRPGSRAPTGQPDRNHRSPCCCLSSGTVYAMVLSTMPKPMSVSESSPVTPSCFVPRVTAPSYQTGETEGCTEQDDFGRRCLC